MHNTGTPLSTHRLYFLSIAIGIVLLGFILLAEARPVAASLNPVSASAFQDNDCLACHSQPDMVKEFGEDKLLLSIDQGKYHQSVHGNQGLACTDCHIDITGFPHPEYENADSLRGMQIALYNVTKQACATCHAEQEENALDSVHQRALDAGDTNAAVCSDCHHPHYVVSWADRPRSDIPETCARCHSSIYDTYAESIHGSALIGEGNPDVPTCIDCHGLHNIQDPTTAAFRNDIPQLCAKCHTDPKIMDKYGLPTNVLKTYVADFHGTTAILFEQLHPGQPVNTAVCTDCHGIHDIRKVDDPQAGIGLKENLLKRCQVCHPDATANFPDAWMSHYIPSPERYPTVYFVDLFYKIMIPTVIGGMLVFVVSDFVRRLIERRKGGAH